MCGICGFTIAAGAGAPATEAVEDMMKSLRHRGPDGSGSHTGPGIVFGHTRLSIIDLQGGVQPMKNGDGSVVVTFNGEIYNYKELQQDLRGRGYRFHTESDTEVLLHAYSEYGDDFLQRLNGMFAFALWDAREQKLLLARDRMGEKPLYYAEVGGQLVFASELKALREFPGVDLELDLEALDAYLAYGYVPIPDTIYKGIRKLPHAHYLTRQAGRHTIRRYWDASSGVPARSMEDAVEQFRELLDDSVRIRLRSDVPVGAFLSGGTDSTLIVARSSRMYPGTLQTFTIGFGEADFDESADAQETAAHFGTAHSIRRVGGMNLDVLPTLVRQYDEPFADPSALPTYYVTREAATDLKVCLSGDGADELFGGYPQYRMEPCERFLSRTPHALRSAVLGIPARVVPDYVGGKGWLQRMTSDGAQRYQQKIGVFSARERTALFRPELSGVIDEKARLLEPYFTGAMGEIESRQAADRDTYLPDDILVKVDRSSMAHSLEVRTPFLDHRLVEFAAALPLRFMIEGTNQKRVLREVLKAVAPPAVLQRPKQGFALPIRDWFRAGHREFVSNRLLQRDSRLHEYFEPRAVAQLVANHDRGRRDFSDRIWSLLWLEEWFRAFG